MAIAGAISAPLKGHLTMQRNANMPKFLKKNAFLQILWVSLLKCSPLSVPRINFCPSVKLCNMLYVMYLQSSKWA